jgi:nicotinamide-nucleotide amidase
VRGSDVAAVDLLVDEVCAGLGDAVFGIDDHRPVVELVGEALRERGWRLGLAESCTGGLLGSIVTAVAGSSDWFNGSLVTYSNESKVAVAGIDPATLAEHGAVSEPIARELARGARRVLETDVAIGITGVAGPGGGTPERPVGTVHVAIETPDGVWHRQLRMPGNRETVRRRTCNIALHELRIALGR